MSGRLLAILFLMTGSAVASSAAAADAFVQSDKCPFTVGVIDAMKVDPLGGGQNASTRYRTTETADSVRASFTEQSGGVHIAYTVLCSAADPTKWLSHYATDETAACKRVNHYRNAEMQANAYCALSAQGDMHIMLTGTWGTDAHDPSAFRERARFTAAQTGVGIISGRVVVTSTDSGQARKLAEQLFATLAVKSKAQ